jgi:hypothetical protein
MEEYDNDKWRIISGKVGNGFSAAACKDKATELETGTETQHHEPERGESEALDEPTASITDEKTTIPQQERRSRAYPRPTETYDISSSAEGS